MTFLGFPKVKWLRVTSEVDKSVRFHVKFSQDLTNQNYSNQLILTELGPLFKKLKGGRFWDTVYTL